MSLSTGVLGYLGLGSGAASTVLGAQSARQEAEAQKRSAEWNAGIYEQNAAIREAQGQQALIAGEHEVAAAREQGHQTIETQRASFAASGVKVDSGSALDVVTEQAGKNAYDQKMIQYNAKVNAWGYNAEASTMRQQAAITRAGGSSISPGLAGATSLLSGTTSLLNQYRQYTVSGK